MWLCTCGCAHVLEAIISALSASTQRRREGACIQLNYRLGSVSHTRGRSMCFVMMLMVVSTARAESHTHGMRVSSRQCCCGVRVCVCVCAQHHMCTSYGGPSRRVLLGIALCASCSNRGENAIIGYVALCAGCRRC